MLGEHDLKTFFVFVFVFVYLGLSSLFDEDLLQESHLFKTQFREKTHLKTYREDTSTV